MKRSKGSGGRRRQRLSPERRAELLAAFERSDLSAAAFAREQGIAYSTFCSWRQGRPAPAPEFIQVELAHRPVELVLELGSQARLRISSADQVELVASLLRHLNVASPC